MHLVMHECAFANSKYSTLTCVSSLTFLNWEADPLCILTSALWGETVSLSNFLKSSVKNEAFYSALLLASKTYFSNLGVLE